MASASDIRAGGAFVELYLKGGHLVEQGLDKVANKTRAFAMSLSTVASISNITYGHSATAIRTSLMTIAGTIDKTSRAIQTTVKTTAKVVTETLDSIPKAVGKAGKALESMGTKTLFAGLMGGGAGFQTMATFMEYERQMARVKALTGATGAEFQDMTDVVRHLGRTTEYTTAQVADGMAYLAMAGLKSRDAMDVLPTVLDLATAAQMELGQTADILTDIGLAFGYTGTQVERVADVIAQAATNSNTTVEMMGMSFKYLASFAVAAGQSI
ncbi:MAG: phage tail tape measure protein, partial [Planctomycetaceae bacterium]|nr:phage tail tape measure protein [Planctomycetaceae bacterium]